MGATFLAFRRMDDFMSRSTPPQPHLTELMDPDGNVSMCQNATHLDTTRPPSKVGWNQSRCSDRPKLSSLLDRKASNCQKPAFASPRRKPNRLQGSWEAWVLAVVLSPDDESGPSSLLRFGIWHVGLDVDARESRYFGTRTGESS